MPGGSGLGLAVGVSASRSDPQSDPLDRFQQLDARLPSASARWESAAFARELAAWVASEAGAPTSLEPLKIRAWAGVWRAETPTGVYFAKQNVAAQAFEAALLVELTDLVPERVVPLTAVDLDRGLLMTPDQGPVLAATAGNDVEAWCRVVTAGAQLQREVAPEVDRLAGAGAVALAPSDSRAYVERRLDDFASLADDDPRRLPDTDLAGVARLLPTLDRWVDQVGALGLPLTLCHNDLHGNNVFERDGRLRFFDFADALLMEPLSALLIPLNLLGHHLEAGPDDPRLARVADAALEVWSDLAPLPALRAALPAALQLARLGRTESWIRCLTAMTDAELAEWGDAGRYWLSALQLDPPFGHLGR